MLELRGEDGMPYTTCIVRRDILERAAAELEELSKKIENSLNKEI